MLANLLKIKAFFLSNRETVLMCQVCNAVAQGLMQPWIPNLSVPTVSTTNSKEKLDKPADKAKGRHSGKATKGGPSKTSVQTTAVDPEGIADLKKALEVSTLYV